MRTVVADSGPLRYLLLIDMVEILPALMDHVLIPSDVRAEFDQPRTPEKARTWITTPPPWLTVRSVPVLEPILADPALRVSTLASAQPSHLPS